jgi:acetoin utilization deacetylase AcuC-like enzyme
MKAFHSDQFEPDLPAGHRFPMSKYRLLRERVAASLPGVGLLQAPAADDATLCLAHDAAYVAAVSLGTVTAAQVREIGFPWSAALVERSRRSVGATLAATDAAMQSGVALNLAGGTHHAQAHQGSGFCVFNDVAVAIRRAQGRRPGLRCLVIDLDVHQGNGTADIFADDADVFTLSLHGEKNFPFRKVSSSLDLPLPDGCTDEAYLDALAAASAHIQIQHEQRPFDLVFYLAGADPHEGDRLGRLKLSARGMRVRDERVLALAEAWRVPVVVCMAGGYGQDLDVMLGVQLASVTAAWQAWQRRQGASS